MRRAFFFIVAIVFATTSYASIPRASMLDSAPAIATPSPETRIRVSDVLAPFEQRAESELTRALRQAYEQASTTEASGLGRFLSVDPLLDIQTALREPQQWNRYSYVVNNPLKYTDPDGKDKFMAWLLGDAFRDVSTWDALKGALSPGGMMTAINEGRQEWAEDHRAATHGFSPVPTSKTEVGMQMMMMGPIGKFIGTSFGKLGTVVANEAGKITGISGHAINQIITRGMSPALLKSVTSNPTVVLAQSGGRKLFLTGEGAVVLDKAGKVVTVYTKKDFDKKIIDVLDQAARAAVK